MNDIELVNMGNGFFDWKFDDRGVCNVIGESQLRSMVIHAIMLRPSELEQYPYEGKGSSVYSQVNNLGNENTQNLLVENVISTVTSIPGIVDARVTLGDTPGVITEIVLVRDDGTEVVIDAE